MKKGIFLCCLICVFSVCGFAQTADNCTVTIEVTNVVINGGQIILAVFSNAENFKKEEPNWVFVLQADSTAVTQEVTLPVGEYLITAFQDANNNNAMDFNFLGIPKEILGMSNWSGKGFPTRNFDKQKIPINSTTGKVVIGLFKIL